jgi:hypothetical protein
MNLSFIRTSAMVFCAFYILLVKDEVIADTDSGELKFYSEFYHYYVLPMVNLSFVLFLLSITTV